MEKNNKKQISQIQNRQQKRKNEKILKTSGKSKEEINQMINVMNMINGFETDNLPKLKECLLEGDKVKLNVVKIKSHPSWNGYQQEYKDFVESK